MFTFDKDTTVSPPQLEFLTEEALRTLAWSTPIDYENEKYAKDAITEDSSEWDETAIATMRESLTEFLALPNVLIDVHGMQMGQVAHDFVLTANRHGAGFWDRGLSERGERLSEAAHNFSFDVYTMTFGGKLYIQ